MLTQNYIVDEVVITWIKKSSKRYLKFYFKGNFTEDAAVPAIHKWRIEFENQIRHGEKVDLIWNCLEMNKYSSKAARHWKAALSEMNPKINLIWLVTSDTFIKMGAKTVTFLFPLKLKVVNSEEEIG